MSHSKFLDLVYDLVTADYAAHECKIRCPSHFEKMRIIEAGKTDVKAGAMLSLATFSSRIPVAQRYDGIVKFQLASNGLRSLSFQEDG